MDELSTGATARAGIGRRHFLQVAALAGAGAVLTPLPAMGGTRTRAATEALLLSCMDYRLMDDVERYMSGRGLRDKYDHIVLAGASLGAITDKYPAWNTTFWDHLDIAIKLHAIRTVVLVDHRDCGAYKVILGAEHAKDPRVERDTHATQLRQLRAAINTRYPQLTVETLLMSLDGTVEVVA